MNWNKNQDSSMAKRQSRVLEVQARIIVQVHNFSIEIKCTNYTETQIIRVIFSNSMVFISQGS